MIRPVLKDEAFLADLAQADLTQVALTGADPQGTHVWWVGQSGFLVQRAGVRVLFDPYLSDSLTTKYATTDKPHVRMTERVVDPAQLSEIDWVTTTHNHTDHLDADTLLPLFEANPGARLIYPSANSEFIEGRLGAIPSGSVGLAPLETHREGKVTITAVRAAHEHLSPEFAGFVVEIDGFTVYHSGDTVLFEGMEAELERFPIDLALLPINGRGPERRVSGNLWGDEAARLAQAIGARHVIPCHYELFDFNTASPDLFVRTCESIGQSYTVLRAGERWSA